jgi:thiopurine S-methyltransferase
MDNLTDKYWNDRYETNDFGWDVGEVSAPLKKYIEQLNNKELKILIPGAGNAYEAELLYALGFKNVYVLDFAEAPLQNIKKRLPDFPDNQLIQQDFFEHQGQYDLIIEQTFFCAINPDLRKKYVTHMNSLLSPNGKLVGLLFNDVLNTNHPPFGGSKAEYEQLFPEKFDIKKMEPCYNSIKPREGRELFVIMQRKA